MSLYTSSTRTKTATLIATLMIALFGPIIVHIGIAHAICGVTCTYTDPWGTQEVSSSGWLTTINGGVPIYSNGPSAPGGPSPDTYKSINNVNGVNTQTGIEWQCVELVNRLYITKGWITSTWTGNGDQLFGNAPSTLTTEAQGSITFVNPGDVIGMSKSGTPGHVAVISSVNGSSITIASQNTNVVYDTSFALSNKSITFSGWNGYTVQGVIHRPTDSDGGGLPTGASPIKNGGFNQDTSHWSASGTANLVRYTSSSNTGTNPYEDAGFAATNASQTNDSISQSSTVTISSGDTWCATAQVVTVGSGSGGGGLLALWLLGGTAESSTYTFSNLPGGSNWQPIGTCVTATASHTTLKVQFYPTVNGPTIGVDAVDVHKSVAKNAGFNQSGNWTASNANYVIYTSSSNTGTNPYEGSGFGATNTSQSGGSIYQDSSITINPGDTFCASAQVVTVGSNTGGGGSLALWLIGTNPTESSSTAFSGLAGGSNWKPIKTCATATTTHTTVRVQVYPTVNGPTIGLDTLDTHYTMSENGGFNGDSSHWAAYGSLNYANYGSGGTPAPYEGSGYEALSASQTNDSLYQSRGWSINAGDTFCVDAEVSTAGTGSGASGTLALWLLGGTATDSSNYTFSNLPGNNVWTHIQTCAMASTTHNVFKVQFYPTPGSPTMTVDAVDVH